MQWQKAGLCLEIVTVQEMNLAYNLYGRQTTAELLSFLVECARVVPLAVGDDGWMEILETNKAD